MLSSTAHRVDREFQILEAINKYNSKLPDSAAARRVPVPQVYALCMDAEVAGAPFYVMEYVKGRIFTDDRLPHLPQEERFAIWRAAIETLALLATVPVKDLDLPGFAADPLKKPYFPRQVNSMMRVSAAQSKAPVPSYPGGILGDIWGTQELRPYYESGSKIVAQAEFVHGASVVHGDYKLDNMIFHPTEARVIGILDWELCTLGSPLADLGNCLLPFSFPSTELSRKLTSGGGSGSSRMQGLKGVPSSVTGIPQCEQLEKWWVDAMNEGYDWHAKHGNNITASGKPPQHWSYPIPGMEWVRSWMAFRLGIIMQGIAARAATGQASSASALPKRDSADFFGHMAYLCMENGVALGERMGGEPKAKL